MQTTGMNTNEVRHLARLLMNRFSLSEWKLKIGNAKRQYGSCRYGTMTITISGTLAAINPPEETEDTILHEIAHALAGPGAGHGPIWQEWCRRLGAKPVRCHTAELPERPVIGTCTHCGHVYKRYRLPKYRAACSDCCNKHNAGRYSADFLIDWKRNS